ncbi:MAG: response regulator transcription factor [Bacteroidota bacterium]|nr:response regulator transcription factor [Bacteroidota bacterium]MDP4275846.1 response regulator transcription factor [Bacteroidota bacterium]
MKILIVEDEINLRETIVSFLEEDGYCCEQADTFQAGSEKLDLYHYDCLLLDIGLPDGNGLQLIKELKKLHPDTGIIIISAKNSLDDKIAGLDLGADDYITKPFHLTELTSRIKALLRRRKFEGRKEIVVDKLRIIPENRQVYANGELLILTKKEFDLLLYFVTNPNRVLTKEAIAEHLWGDFADSCDSFDFVYSQIKNLRRKLLEKTNLDYFQNVYGTGYTFKV